MNFTVWLYNLHGSRKRLYDGRSHEEAEKMEHIVSLAIELFRVDASVVITKKETRAVTAPEKPLNQNDYYEGFIDRTKRKRVLVLALEGGQ